MDASPGVALVGEETGAAGEAEGEGEDKNEDDKGEPSLLAVGEESNKALGAVALRRAGDSERGERAPGDSSCLRRGERPAAAPDEGVDGSCKWWLKLVVKVIVDEGEAAAAAAEGDSDDEGGAGDTDLERCADDPAEEDAAEAEAAGGDSRFVVEERPLREDSGLISSPSKPPEEGGC